MKSMNKAIIGVLVAICALACLQSCKPSIPSQYLSEGKMEDILYDIHLAEAMASNATGADTAIMLSYRVAVLKKHEVTSAEFDSSMVYYMRHTKLLHDIYVRIGDRLTAEAQSLGADVNELNRYGAIEMGDTANVWNGAGSLVFSANAPFNYSAFEIPVDSGFHKGDKLMFEFDSQFLFQDGMRDGIAVLAVTFKNDSVCANSLHLSNSQHYSLQIEDRDSLGVKRVRGYFLLNSGDYNSGNSSLTTLKMMFVQNIKLIRLHPQKKSAGSDKKSDGGKSGAADSTLKSTSTTDGDLPKPRPHLSGPDKLKLDPDKLEKLEVRNEEPHR